ncbi:prenyltransferase/squalene oxidase repeat-containing protein [Phycisphaera mikurensis]|uniref:Squalene cyclase C-terminal domain-containing protein n=1 Tax=Phycisphaera mikurensis (strain NBRC 102666 / KCTC 22515 / FYK2301M01) TaxID=1142394 RepID=I0ID33_PHYMF|nr:prenyltransferase/squalene oxidase repeat-containing protein [Phycisphaera mikurensis]MBB6442296.1 squalene-hopene/tetraprenyl-beta-curcumene cyclase [Phycisphaera mikurensis]BAM03171.1 hypothetical protein PSMK_10120 [Phycisphaera mikurensis NBRC 102666]
MRKLFLLAWGAVVPAVLAAASHAAPADRGGSASAEAAVRGGLGFLVQHQDADGAWSPGPGPAVTALVLRALLQDGRTPPTDPAAAAALSYVLDAVQPDGSFRGGPDGMLANYNTAICVSALAQLPGDPRASAAVRGGVDFLRAKQWQAGMTDPAGDAVDDCHPYFGGAGYGRHGRPDVSNTQMMVQALHDAGLSPSDPAFQRAATFIARCQGSEANDFFPPGTIKPDGGIIYSTSEDRGNIGVPQSMANPGQLDPTVDEGLRRPVSGLRGYGSMTYAGFKSFLYAGLTREDPRVAAALGWIRENHTLERNPGMPDGLDQQGLYYYYLVYGQALAAFGEDLVEQAGGDPLDWRAALAAALAQRQRPDGSWSNDEDRWMEGDPNLATAFAVLALQAAAR